MTQNRLEKIYDVDYNLVYIPYTFHILLHIIRYLELKYHGDKIAINSFLRFTKKNEFVRNILADILLELFDFI